MAKRSYELTIRQRSTGVAAYRWLYSALRDDILSGRLRAGTRLPSTRDLAQQYQLSRGTVVRAFEELNSEGYLEGTIGSGTYVSRLLPEQLLQVSTPKTKKTPSRVAPPRLSAYARRATVFPNFENRPTRAFRTNVPALELFPMELWTQTVTRRLRRATTRDLLTSDAMGFMPLRRAIADYLVSSRGVKCDPEQVALVSGVQEALNLAARMLIEPGDRVAMEDPGYPGAAKVFEAVGAQIVAMPLDAEGMCIDHRRLAGVRMVYVTPAHQFPLGITMSLSRRLQLLDWAKRNRATIFEDDYDSEYRYSGSPIPAMQGLDSSASVLFAGTFSKVLFPSLRLGYLVVPSGLVDPLTAAISITNRHAPLLEQSALCDFILEGHFGRHLRRMRIVYAERFEVLRQSIANDLSPWLTAIGAQAGLQLAAWLHGGVRDQELLRLASAQNIEFSAISSYSRSGKHNGVHLGFAAFPEREIRRGVQQLHKVLSQAERSRRR